MVGLPVSPRHVALQDIQILSRSADEAYFLELARPCGTSPYSAVLLSGGPLRPGGENRYSFAAWDPFLILRSKGMACTLWNGSDWKEMEAHPLDLLDELFERVRPDFSPLPLPFSGGALGYFAYDLKNVIERLPQTARDETALPDLLLFWPRRIMAHDRLTGELCLLRLDSTDSSSLQPAVSSPKSVPPHSTALTVGALRSNFTHEAYVETVRTVQEYIRAGDVYQVNLSQRYQFELDGDPFTLWEALFRVNPAPFYAFIHGNDHQILSTSMERFLLRRGSLIETRPIKGTRPRGGTAEEDQRWIRDLFQSPKDDAELSMIVDLLRNDLGRVCAPRSIRVAEHKRLESYQNVHHLISIVTGELLPEATYGEILRATFPGGSITGCPKIRAMEIIDELEPHVRHVYTGSIGYLGWHGNMDLNIAIRTALVHRGTCYFSVGGGVVFDSSPEEEYQETLHKGRTLFQVVERIGKGSR